jgi:probable HAF family extracellular repeat protein
VLPAGTVHGFMWHRGEFTTIDYPGAPLTQPLGINNDGDIVGAYLEADVDPDDPYSYFDTGRLRGFVLRDGQFTPVDFPGGQGTKVSGINDRGQMVGYYDTPEARRGFLLKRGTFTEIDPPGSLTTLPSGINNHGQVVGAYLDPNGVNGRGFLWKDGRYTTIVAPGNRTDTIALAINDKGDILIPADGNYYRLPEIACGKPTTPATADQTVAPGADEPGALAASQTIAASL